MYVLFFVHCTFDQFKNVVIEAAKSVLGPKQRIHQDWFDDTRRTNHTASSGEKQRLHHLAERPQLAGQKSPVQAIERAGTEKAAGDERCLVGPENRSADVCWYTQLQKVLQRPEGSLWTVKISIHSFSISRWIYADQRSGRPKEQMGRALQYTAE